jgi:hypothetical protein
VTIIRMAESTPSHQSNAPSTAALLVALRPRTFTQQLNLDLRTLPDSTFAGVVADWLIHGHMLPSVWNK